MYYSERNEGSAPRGREDIDSRLWGGIVSAISRRVDSGEFGRSFPLNDCHDNPTAVVGTNSDTMGLAVLAEIPALTHTVDGKDSAGWPLYHHHMPPISAILDLLEFCYKHVAHIEHTRYHDFFGHEHLFFDVGTGQAELRDDINTMFRRNRSVYEMDYHGDIERIGTSMITTTVKDTVFNTGDSTLDTLLENAREKYLDRSPKARVESLHALWDALERMKTIEDKNKKRGIELLISKVTCTAEMGKVIDDELSDLTDIGNNFRIRHHEVGKIDINLHDVDYLFHRAFATVAHLLKLKARGRT